MVTGGEPRAPRPGWDHTQPVLLGGRGRTAYSRAGLGRKTTKLGWSWKNLPRDPPGSRRRCLDAAKGRHAAGRAPTRAGRARCLLPATDRAGPPAAQFGPVCPSCSQERRRGRSGGRGIPQRWSSPWPQQEGARRHMVLGQPGRGGARLLRNPWGRRWGSVLGRNRPDSAHLAPASPLPGPRPQPSRSEPPRSQLAHPDTDAPQAGFLPFFFLLMDTK